MKKILCWIAAGLILSGIAGGQSDKARSIVERAIAAQGGKEKVARLRCMRIKVEGRTNFVPSQPNLPFIIEDIWQMPDKYRTSSTITFMGQKHVQTEVINGDKGWMEAEGMVQDLPAADLAEMKEQKHAEDLDRLGFLKTKGIDVNFVGEAQVGGKPADVVSITSPGHKNVKLFFDKASGLLVKREHRLFDAATGKEVLQEVFFSDYRDKDGLKHYYSIVAHRDGKSVIEGKVVELEFYSKLDPKTFARPSH